MTFSGKEDPGSYNGRDFSDGEFGERLEHHSATAPHAVTTGNGLFNAVK